MLLLLDKIKYYSKSITLRVIIIMILLVIPLNIWGIYTVSKMQEYMFIESRNNMYSVGQLTMKELDERMRTIDFFLFDALPNTNLFFTTFLLQKGDASFYHAVYNLHTDLYSRVASSRDADIYYIYAADVAYWDVTGDVDKNFDRKKIEKVLNALIEEEVYGIQKKWTLLEMDGELWLLRCAQQKTLYYGAMVNINDVYEDVYSSFGYKTVQMEMQANQRKILYEEETVAIIESENKNIAITEDTASAVLDTPEQITTVCTSDKADIYLNLSVEKKEIIQNLPLLQRAGVIISFVFCLVLPFIIWFLYHYLLKPIHILLEAMNTVKSGKWDHQIEETAKSNEFEELYDNFNSMIRAQERMKQEIIEKEVYAKKMELQTLQLQIRPHFLLNSFNLLYGLVTMNKIESSQKMILYLSDYFRYIFRSGKELELYEKEVALIRNYIDVARLRHPFISFEEEHDQEVQYVAVPPLLIHNFIENILKHALNVKGMTAIRLTAGYENGIATFVIMDDGRGMEESVVEAINSKNFKKDDESIHIGIENAYQRINSFYGESASLTVKSTLGEGTTVIIRVPCIPEKREEI